MKLSTQLSQLAGIGPMLLNRLSRLNIFTVEDLIHHYPFRYDDFSKTTNALEAKVGEVVTLRGEVWDIKNIYTRSRKVLTQAVFNDGTSPVTLTWFNQSWLTKQIKTGDRLQVSGKVNKYKNKLSIVAPVWEKLPDYTSDARSDLSETRRVQSGTIHTGKLVAVYPETYGLTSKWIRTKTAQLLPEVEGQIEDSLPEVIREGMVDLRSAIQKIHFPQTHEDVILAKNRLGFDELFFVQLATLKTRLEWKRKPVIERFPPRDDPPLAEKVENFVQSLPFELTKAQRRVIDEILADLERDQPMNRLVQGEVGSGKTVVAAVIAYVVYLNGFKSLFMAPTEILAFQHHQTLSKLLAHWGIKVGIQTGSKKNIPEADIVVGTHALLNLDLENVGLVIVDEQQRFGVEQRTLLRSKAKIPHFLTMTATPIPRTVALTLYGDLDLSIIDELPKNRLPVKTHVVPKNKREAAYGFIKKHVLEGNQVYIITPLIEESETMQSAKAAKVEFEKLSTEVFPDLRLALLHGRLGSKEKEAVMNGFKDHNTDVLVSTSVVEVGVDVANATIMVVEGAERFGLAQLHQLRGRVGRGHKQSYCLLFSEDKESVSRLKNLEKINDGLKLAELDLKIRGSGEIFGTRQSGRWEFKMANLSDLTLVEKTREAAKKILDEDPSLDKYLELKGKLASLAPNVMPD